VTKIKSLQPYDDSWILPEYMRTPPGIPEHLVQRAPLNDLVRGAIAHGHPLAQLQMLTNVDKHMCTVVAADHNEASVRATAPAVC